MIKEQNFPAFPTSEDNGCNSGDPGMTLRQYAAIKLKVPDSGEAWLDAMIVESRKLDALQQVLGGPNCFGHDDYKDSVVAGASNLVGRIDFGKK